MSNILSSSIYGYRGGSILVDRFPGGFRWAYTFGGVDVVSKVLFTTENEALKAVKDEMDKDLASFAVNHADTI
jgi:hypothetical protein